MRRIERIRRIAPSADGAPPAPAREKDLGYTLGTLRCEGAGLLASGLPEGVAKHRPGSLRCGGSDRRGAIRPIRSIRLIRSPLVIDARPPGDRLDRRHARAPRRRGGRGRLEDDADANSRRGDRAECCVRSCRRLLLDAPFGRRPDRARHRLFLQTDAGRQTVDDGEPERHRRVLLLRQYRTELPSIWPSVYVGIGAAGMSIAGRWMAIADERRMAADGEALRWSP